MDIAIIGMSGRFPEAKNIDEFFNNLCQGKDSVRTLSDKRLENSSLSKSNEYQVLGYLERIDLFDHDFFDISLGEANYMDPRQRLLLEVAYETLENSGYGCDFFDGTNTSVFVGDTTLDYYQKIQEFDPTLITGNMNAALAGRIARFLNLRGGALMIDTTCSSSLVALHYACCELELKNSDHVIVCGINLILFPDVKNDNLGQIGIKSSDGKAKAFSSDADGTGHGEVVVAVLLKPLEKAIADSDRIHGVIKGSAVNQDARLSGTLTAPSSTAQSEVIGKAYLKAKIEPPSINYIEAHGTGTKLGDPIEIEGINLALKKFTKRRKYCAISSLKSNIGHTDSAAGLAGIVKVVLSLKNRVLFPSLHFKNPNPFIDFEDSVVYVNNKFLKWGTENNGKRRAGISSFGLSGTNCHVILEEPPRPRRKSRVSGFMQKKDARLINISAKSKESLKANIRELEDFYSSKNRINMTDLSGSLCCGRDHFNFRYSVIVDSRKNLLNSLNEAWLNFKNPKELKPVQDIIFVFSDQPTISKPMLKEFGEEHPEFEKHMDSLFENCPEEMRNSNFYSFAFQYSFFHLLKSYGITSSIFIGEGIGDLVVSALSKKISLRECISRLTQWTSNDTNSTEKRCSSIAKQFSDKPVLYMDIGFESNIIRGFKTIKKDRSDYKLVSLPSKSENKYLGYIRSLYLANYDFVWSKFYPKNSYNKIDLPSYQFAKMRCWFEEPKLSNVKDWFYRLDWVKEPTSETNLVLEKQTYLIFTDTCGLTDAIVEELERSNNKCIRVAQSKKFKRCSATSYEVDLQREDSLEKLKNDLNVNEIKLTGILCLNSYLLPRIFKGANLEEELSSEVFSQFNLTKIFGDYLSSPGFQWVVVTANAFKVLKEDIWSQPTRTLPSVFAKAILAEFPTLKVTSIDLDFKESPNSNLVKLIINEIVNDEIIKFTAFRKNNEKYVQELVRNPGKKNEHIHETPFKEGGTYLISGGLGGIGIELCKFLSSFKAVHLILLGRTKLSAKKDWDQVVNAINPISDRISKLKSIENLGAKIEYINVDVADEKSVASLFRKLKSRSQKINGVIHAAGLTGNWKNIKEKSIEAFKATLRPKVQGTSVLMRACQSLNYEFFVLFSSINSIVPQRFSLEYAIANAFLDEYAKYVNVLDHRVTSINWPGWKEIENEQKPMDNDEHSFHTLKPIGTMDGLNAFHEAIKLKTSNLIVANVDLHKYLNNPFFKVASELTSLPVEPDKQPPVALSDTGNIEGTILAIWSKILKSNSIKCENNFFQIGGHSLNSIQVINQIKAVYKIELQFEDILENPTAKDLAKHIGGLIEPNKLSNNHSIEPIATSAYYDTSHAQKRLWIFSQFKEGESAYNLPGVFAMKGRLDVDALEQAFKTLIQRHDSFRTIFLIRDGELKQTVLDLSNPEFKIVQIDLEQESSTNSIVKQTIEAEIMRPFYLNIGPLMRVKLLRVKDTKFILIFTIHHIIADGWSMDIVIEEVISLYNAYLKGLKNPLKSNRVQYKDYVAWQLMELKSSNELQKKYWLDNLKGFSSNFHLPTDYKRPAVKTYNGKRLVYTLNVKLTTKINLICRRRKVSLFMFLLSSVKSLLYRYTGRSNITIGTPVAGRLHEDVENMIGCFLNILALRTNFNPLESFASLLRKVKKTTLGAFANQSYPFDSLIEDLKIQRDTSHSPLFGVMIILQNISRNDNKALDIQGLDVEKVEVYTKVSRYDLTFDFKEVEKHIWFAIEFNTDLFSSFYINQLSSHLVNLISHVTNNLDIPVQEINILSSKEKRRLLTEFNSTQQPYPKEKTIVHLFEERTFEYPKDVALVFDGKDYTYQEINERSNQLARFLVEQCAVKPNSCVSVIIGRSSHLLTTLLGILKAGAAYLPIDPKFSQKRIQYILNDSNVNIVLITKAINLLEFSNHLKVIKLDEIDFSHWGKSNLSIDIKPDYLIYLIYTSGSTGRPKGVEISHKSVTNFMTSMDRKPGIEKKDTLLALTTYSFDISVLELFWPLLSGAKVILANDEKVTDPLEFKKFVKLSKPTLIQATPSMFQMLLDSGWEPTISLKLLCGGEFLPKELGIRLLKLPGSLWNMYGPTETTIWSTIKKVEREDDLETIGKPIDNTKIYILDSAKQPLPIGIPGELSISGDGLARGYHNNRDLSSTKFIPNNFVKEKDARIYRTGDFAKWNNQGELVFLGRLDNQVKIRGHRVELGEIESTLSKIENIKQSAVAIKSDSDNNQLLVAYIKSKHKPDLKTIREMLKKELPQYMIPDHYVFLESLPLNANGKIDRRALPLPSVRPANVQHSVNPKTNEELQLLKVWKEVLNVDQISIQDNFFELGGHSIKAAQIIGRIFKTLKIKLELRHIFESPTIEELAQIIKNTHHSDCKPIDKVGEKDFYNITPAQRRLWILQQFEEQQVAYNMVSAYVIEGKIEKELCQRAFETLVNRHEVLRTTIKLVEGEPKQIISSLKSSGFSVEYIDLRKKNGRQKLAKEIALKVANTSFSLEKGPLFKVSLIQTENEKYVLVYAMHHIISDGWSMGILERELSIIYYSYCRGRKNPLLPLSIQYKDYAEWQAQELRSNRVNRHKRYWLNLLKGELPVIDLPTYQTRPKVQTFSGKNIAFKFPSHIYLGLSAISKKNGVSLFMTLVTVISILFQKYTDKTDLVFGTDSAGRNRKDLENNIGLFLDALALRIKFGSKITFVSLLKKVRMVILKAHEHQLYPFDNLVDDLGINRDLSRTPIFDVLVMLQNFHDRLFDDELNTESLEFDLRVSPLNLEVTSSLVDLEFSFGEANGILYLSIRFNTDLFKTKQIRRLAKHFENLVGQIINDPFNRIYNYELLSDFEKNKLLHGFNNTKVAFPWDKTILDYFEIQVNMTPTSIAVVFENASLNYKELNAKANAVANLLIRIGAKKGSYIPILMERGIDFVISFLGILKSESIAVPLDSQWPKNRIKSVIAELKCPVVIVDEERQLLVEILKFPYQKIDYRDLTPTKVKPNRNVGNEDGIYVIYTSGSTGRPKGVIVKHKGITNRFLWMNDYFGKKASKSVLRTTKHVYDSSVWQLFWPLINGGKTVIPSVNKEIDINYLLDTIQEHKITTIDFVPFLFSKMVSKLKKGDVKINSLSHVVVGGEEMDISAANQFKRKYPKIKLTNLYGPTEASIGCVYYPIGRPDNISIPIGKPISNVRVHILNSDMNMVPQGTVGEIYIGGACLAKGYFNNSKENEKLFFKDPFCENGRLFKTGDIGRYTSNGNIEFLGRKDNQVKIRGYRIELGEIENCIMNFGGIEKSIIMVTKVEDNPEYLIAYFTGAAKVDLVKLRSHLIKRLPQYMVPNYFIYLEDFPTNEGGKIDRKALPIPNMKDLATSNYVAPNTAIEKRLAVIWKDVLNRQSIGLNDNFFELGGHSLKAIQMLSKISLELNITLDLKTIFQYPTIEKLTLQIEALNWVRSSTQSQEGDELKQVIV